jgi:hypothetical protein
MHKLPWTQLCGRPAHSRPGLQLIRTAHAHMNSALGGIHTQKTRSAKNGPVINTSQVPCALLAKNQTPSLRVHPTVSPLCCQHAAGLALALLPDWPPGGALATAPLHMLTSSLVTCHSSQSSERLL